MLTLTFLIFQASELNAQSKYSAPNSLKLFLTDGCTQFIDGPLNNPSLWKHCCVEHDLRYWFGGDQADLDRSDLRLKVCVRDVAGDTWAKIIYSGVRLGHHSPIKNKSQWGWGWENKRLNNPLDPSEQNYVIEEIRKLPLDSDFLENFIELNFKK